MNNEGYQITYTGEEVQELLDKAGTAVQTETDPTVPSWAKSSSKPSYNYSEISGTPTLANVATSGSYNDLTNKPTIPDAQIQSDWNQSNTSAKDYIKNKPTIPVVPSNVSAFTNDAGYITTESDPTVPSWAKQSSKPSYAVGEISGAQETLVSGTNIKTINGNSVLGSGNISIQGGDANVIESISFNGSSVPVDNNKNAAITYTAPVTSVNGNTGAVSLSIPTESTVSGWGFTKNAGTITGVTMNGASKGTSGVVDLGTVITAHQDISGKADKATTLSGYGITDAKIVSGVITLGSDTITPLTSHQDISGKADKSEMSVSTSSDQTTITLKSGTSATVINQHQSLSGYVQTSNTAGLIKNDGTIDTTSYGTYSKPSGGIPASDIASGVIPTVPSNIVTGSSQSYTIWSGTQAEYDALATKDNNTIYLIKES